MGKEWGMEDGGNGKGRGRGRAEGKGEKRVERRPTKKEDPPRAFVKNLLLAMPDSISANSPSLSRFVALPDWDFDLLIVFWNLSSMSSHCLRAGFAGFFRY